MIAEHGLAARRALGQNFLLDLNLTGRIARGAGDLGAADVLEIGPGPGGLTRALLAEGARRVVAVERDARCLPALAAVSERWAGRLEVIEGDALALPHAALVGRPAVVAANLPYNIGTELLVRWLRGGGGADKGPEGAVDDGAWPPWWSRLTLMFQREVAERIVATPGSAHYGRLAVLAGWRTRARILFDISPAAFTPPPKVTSAVVSIAPCEPVAAARLTALERVTTAAFGQRRKMLRQALRTLGRDPAPLLDAAGVDPQARAETLDVPAFCALARALEAAEG